MRSARSPPIRDIRQIGPVRIVALWSFRFALPVQIIVGAREIACRPCNYIDCRHEPRILFQEEMWPWICGRSEQATRHAHGSGSPSSAVRFDPGSERCWGRLACPRKRGAIPMYFRHLGAVCALTAVLVSTGGCCWRRCCRPDSCARPCYSPGCCDTTSFYPSPPAPSTNFGNSASLYAPTASAGTVH
jgi:hypothetical protein